MAQSMKIKTKDICEALDIGRHQLRGWTEQLAPYCHRETRERSANHYDFGDLLFFAVVKHINESLGISISFIAKFSESLYTCVREPQDLTSTNIVFINTRDNSCQKVDTRGLMQEGIVINIQPAQLQACEYLGLSAQQQTQLQLGLMKVN